MITTRNAWTIDGKVTDVKEVRKGYWLTVRTSAKIPAIYALKNLELGCFISKEVANTAYKKESYFKKLHATGKFVFKKDECYFLVEQLLL